MRPERLLLRFDDRPQAIAVLGAAGIALDAVSGGGVIRRATGEVGMFEGEAIALTCPVAGYHVSLVWCGKLPHALEPYLVREMAPKADAGCGQERIISK